MNTEQIEHVISLLEENTEEDKAHALRLLNIHLRGARAEDRMATILATKGKKRTVPLRDGVPMKNWFGREWHPSDELVHWTRVKFCKKGTQEDPEFKKFVDQLRADWDLLTSDDGVGTGDAREKAFARMMEATRDKASSDQAEIDAGENL